MLIDCSYCQSRVDAALIGENIEEDGPPGAPPTLIAFVKCPVCSKSLLGYAQEYAMGVNESKWSDLTRLWPEPANYLDYSIPGEVRSSLEEAQKCYQAKAFSACAVMCGRAIEAICVAHTTEGTFQGRLQALRDSGIIDGRLFDWGDSLREERNVGAHATGEKVNAEDAKDVLEFATAICEYVYVLSDRYDRYKKRKGEREQGE